MKKLFSLLFSTLLVVAVAQAQMSTPAPSPSCKVKQMVGLTEVVIEYSRPSMKEREIFGNLVPHGAKWRTGANQATKISFDKDVMLGGEELAAGSYAIVTKPMESSWDFMLYPYESGNWSSYDEAEPAASFSADVNDLGDITMESFTIFIGNLRNSSATLDFAWENSHVGVPIEVHTDKEVMASIESTMGGPSANEYFQAASYYHAEGKDLNKALEWINKSIDMNPDRFWVLRAKSLIQAELGDHSGAIMTAKKSLELAKEAGNDDYIKMNTESIEKWSM